MLKSKWVLYAALILAGCVLNNKIRALPGGSRIPIA